MQSGTKLVLLLSSLALALGVVSWWNRYSSAHRATEFWGPENARLIVEPGEVEALLLAEDKESEVSNPASPLAGYSVDSRADVSKAPGLAHLRFALTSDSNYTWGEQPGRVGPWKWAFRFSGEAGSVLVFFTEDFETLGKLAEQSSSVEVVSCEPMAETLREYFLAKQANLPTGPDTDASNTAE